MFIPFLAKYQINEITTGHEFFMAFLIGLKEQENVYSSE